MTTHTDYSTKCSATFADGRPDNHICPIEEEFPNADRLRVPNQTSPEGSIYTPADSPICTLCHVALERHNTGTETIVILHP